MKVITEMSRDVTFIWPEFKCIFYDIETYKTDGYYLDVP